MNVDLFCVCWNEMKILPFVIEYWKKFVRHAYVFDTGSDDGTIEYLSKFDWITVEHFDSNGLDDDKYLEIKNNAWKKSDADWVVVCDIDECLFGDNLLETLKEIDSEGYSLIRPVWINLVNPNFPIVPSGKMVHECVKGGKYEASKWILFKPNKIEEINYTPGAHNCSPIGDVKKYEGSGFNIFHLRKFGLEYILERYKAYNKRMSRNNIIKGYGIHYRFPEDVHRRDMEENLKTCKPISDLIK